MMHEEQPVPIPVVTDHYVNIYKPQGDVYTLPTRQVRGRGQCTFTYEQGKSYPDWRTNDHTFIKDHHGRWHCFGITKPWMSGDNSHAGEGLCFHAVAPETENGTFAEAVGRDYVYTHKPNPSNVSMEGWDLDLARDQLRDALEKTRDNIVEVNLQDLHTVHHEPNRLTEWAEMAMQLAEEYA